MKTCALCGEPILDEPMALEDQGTDEHVPPLQFFPKAMRPQLRKELWKVPSHRRCNQQHKLDEEYFLHYVFPLVAVLNEPMGQVLLKELKRRAKNPQTRGLIRRMLKECTLTSPGGIILPPPLVRVNFDLVRIQKVVVKIAKCLFYKDHDRYMPRSACVHVEMCERESDLQPIFAELSNVREFEQRSAAPGVFRYWHFNLDGQNLYAMLFWNAFMFCMIFNDPIQQTPKRSGTE